MKKLFIYALLAMTGFAFYSCDDRFDNPVTEQQDASSPYATWTYEVGIQFENFYTNHPDVTWNNWGNWDVDGEDVFYKAPTTVYVYNKAGEFLGEMNATEEFDYDNFDWSKYYKFAGTLTGAIGEELIISTLKDFDYYSKQDGTLKSLVENCVLEIAEVPIIVANNATKKIGTQNAKFESAILAMFGRFNNFGDDTDRSFTLTSDSLAYVPANDEGARTFTINLAEAVKPQSEGLFWAFAPGAKESTTYTWELNSDNGYKGINAWKGQYNANNSLNSIYELNFIPKELDLTKYTKFLKEVKEQEAPYYIGISTTNDADYEPIITQSGKDTLEVQLSINGKATLKDLTIRNDYGYALRLSGSWYTYEAYTPTYEENYLPVITLQGKNSFKSPNSSYAMRVNSDATLKGDGELELEGISYGINIYSGWTRGIYDENWNWKEGSGYYSAKLNLNDKVKVKTNGVYVNRYNPNGEYIPCELNVNGGSFESTGNEGVIPVRLYGGKLNIGADATSVKATTGQTGDNPLIIAEYDFTNYNWTELAKFDETKYTDTTKDGVRTITPKK